MPPKIKVTKEDVLNAAFRITQKSGWENVNARNIAKGLGCSTQPIFRVFENMSALKSELFAFIENYYNSYIEKRINPDEMFKSVGRAYVSFAGDEKQLFKMLFMTDNFRVESFMEMIEGDNKSAVAEWMAQSEKISVDGAKRIFVEMWLFTHGIASMIATNNCKLGKEEISDLMGNAYLGFLYRIKQKEENHGA